MSHGPGVGMMPQFPAAAMARKSAGTNLMSPSYVRSEEEMEEEDDDDDMGYGLFDDGPVAPGAAKSISPLPHLLC